MTTTAGLHALAKTRADCAQRVADLGDTADPTEIAAAHAAYQVAEDSYQRALSLLTNHELINMRLKP